MFIEPCAIVLYVENLETSSSFYQDLLGLTAEKVSPTFYRFKLTKGMIVALKGKHTVEPPVDKQNGNGELAFTLDTNKKVDDLFEQLKAKEITIILPPSSACYGYNFVALDPDGNRLRVVCLVESHDAKQEQ